MATPLHSSQEEHHPRPQLPPVEGNYVVASSADAANDASMQAPSVAANAPHFHPAGISFGKSPANLAPSASASSGMIGGISHWISQHRDAPKHGAGLWVYQIVRSGVAAIPYGISMALTLAAFTGMERGGAKLVAQAGEKSLKGILGARLNQFATSPAARNGALIGTSFTFYRGTSKLGKWMTEYLFNPNDTEQRTNEKMHDLPKELGRKIKEIAPAEVSSTPVAAVVLGFILTAFKRPEAKELVGAAGKSINWTAENFRNTIGVGNKLKLMGSVIAHPKAKFVEQALINTFGYSLFFEMGDRLFKDKQIARGVWPGEHHSIKALKAAPDEYDQGIKDGIQASAPKYAESALEPVKEKHHYSFFTSEPGLGRFAFRRVLPTAIGITAYTAAKMRWATMLGNDFKYVDGEKLLSKKLFSLAAREGAATSLFFLIPVVAENWEKGYDKFFANKEKQAQLREHPQFASTALNAHQVGKHEELLEKIQAKETAAARG